MALHHITDLWHSQRLMVYLWMCVSVCLCVCVCVCVDVSLSSWIAEVRIRTNIMSSVLLQTWNAPSWNPYSVCSVVEECVLTECSAVFSCLCTYANHNGVILDRNDCLQSCMFFFRTMCSLQLAQQPGERVQPVQFWLRFTFFLFFLGGGLCVSWK